MGIDTAQLANENWKNYQKYFFRVTFVFFLALCIPASASWYTFLFNLDWTNLHCRDLYNITNYNPNFIKTEVRYGIAGYATWGVLFIGSLIVGAIWTFFDRKTKNYNVLYYWLRVIVRYRAALGIIGFGFFKLFPAQMPYPSLGILNTDFGDFTQQKVYWMSIAVVPFYQVFGGLLEIFAGVLLFFRKTVALGSALLISALGAIVAVNIAYDNSLHVYASFFVLAGIFLLFHDIKRVWHLIVLEKQTNPFAYYYPSFKKESLKYFRVGIKTLLLVVFVGLAFYLECINFIYDPYKQPSVKGIKELRGNYDVSEFRINNSIIPYSPTDTVRWQEVTFEKWTSLSFKINKPVQVDLSNGGGSPARDIDRTTESAGLAGGLRVFHYQADTVNKILYLQDKNIAALFPKKNLNERAKISKKTVDTIYPKNWIPKESLKNIGNELYKIHPKAMSTTRIREFKEDEITNRRKMILKYATTDGEKVILSGINEDRDSIYVVLNKVYKKYALNKSKLEAGQY